MEQPCTCQWIRMKLSNIFKTRNAISEYRIHLLNTIKLITLKITELSFQNFRTFKDTEHLTGIAKNNYLIGPNGTGKSNIFRGIQLLKDIFVKSYTLEISDYFDCNNTEKLVVSVTLELTEQERDSIIHSMPKPYDELDLQGTTILKDVRYEVTFRKSAIVNEIFSIRNHLNNFETQIRPTDGRCPNF